MPVRFVLVWSLVLLVIGGSDAPSVVGGRGAERLADALRLREVRYEPVDGDLMVVGYPED